MCTQAEPREDKDRSWGSASTGQGTVEITADPELGKEPGAEPPIASGGASPSQLPSLGELGDQSSGAWRAWRPHIAVV